MGQRHQIFVVARVCVAPGQPRQYRCIVALHHQWCYGKLPLYAVNSFKRLARVPENAALIEEELATYHERKGESPDFPCPYTSLLAESAYSVDLVRTLGPYLSKVSILKADMGSRDGDNNDGITILDVTSPRNPAYCFVSIYGFGAAQNFHPTMTPLTAAEYLRSYYPAPADPRAFDVDDMLPERLNLEAIGNLDDMPLIRITTLPKVWPREYVVSNDELRDSEPSDLENDTVHPIGHKSQLAVYPADIEALRRQSVLSSEDVSRLTTVVKGKMNPDGVVDLSWFPLAGEQILSILQELRDFKRLDVSHNQAVDCRVFLQILELYERLRWISIMHCSISIGDLKELATSCPTRFRSMETILHPAFLTGKLPPDFPKAFRLTYINPFSGRLYEHVTLPFYITDQLVQNIFDIINNLSCYSGVSTPNPTIVASSLLDHDQSWSDRAIQIVPCRDDDGFGTKGYEDQREGYQLVVDGQSQMYGILVPLAPGQSERSDSEIIGMGPFLKRLEEEGLPASDSALVQRLLDQCATLKLITMEQIRNAW